MPGWIVPAAIAVGQALISHFSNRAAAKKQARYNMDLAKFQASANEGYLQAQLAYNTPAAQRGRFEDAGYNANLFYGQGNPGNQSAPLNYPDVGRVDWQSLMQIAPILNQSALTASQVQATNAKTRHTYAMTELNKLQQEVLKKNPLLDKEGFRAIINSLKSTAEIKAGQAEIGNINAAWYANSSDPNDANGFKKLNAEMALLEQRFKLGTSDQAIKSQVLLSKEFQNAILEVQKKFMLDGDITPQHVMQFIQLLLMKML